MPIRRTTIVLALAAGNALAQDDQPDVVEALPTDPLRLEEPIRRGPEIPVVESRDDFFALNRRDQTIYGRTQREPVTILAGFGYNYTGSADLDRGGDFSVNRLTSEFGLSIKVSDDADLIIVTEPSAAFYDFENAEGILPFAPGVGEPIEEAYEVPLRLVYRVDKADGWSWFVGGSVVYAGEPGVEFEDAVYGDGFAAASWWVNDNLRLGFGVRGGIGLDGDPTVFPFPVIEWYPTERFSLVTSGRGISAGYEIGAWRLSVDATLITPEYGLDDDGPLPGGSFRERRFPVAFGVSYSPAPRFNVTGRIGAAVAGEIQFFDAGGGEVADESLDPVVFAGVEISLRF
ncbi:MAG: hypothetical protein AAFQ71_15265 [Planctomycetota bacterium]